MAVKTQRPCRLRKDFDFGSTAALANPAYAPSVVTCAEVKYLVLRLQAQCNFHSLSTPGEQISVCRIENPASTQIVNYPYIGSIRQLRRHSSAESCRNMLIAIAHFRLQRSFNNNKNTGISACRSAGTVTVARKRRSAGTAGTRLSLAYLAQWLSDSRLLATNITQHWNLLSFSHVRKNDTSKEIICSGEACISKRARHESRANRVPIRRCWSCRLVSVACRLHRIAANFGTAIPAPRASSGQPCGPSAGRSPGDAHHAQTVGRPRMQAGEPVSKRLPLAARRPEFQELVVQAAVAKAEFI